MKNTNAKNTILVIEDELPLLKAISTKLKKNNFSVLKARTVKQALITVKTKKNIKVIWLDHYLLGQENGLDFITTLKNNKLWKKIPIFVVSNTASAEKIKAYLKLGIKNYYTKADYRLEQIIDDIKKTLKN